MKKAKRNVKTAPKAINQAPKYDMTHKGFALDHEEKMLWVMEATDIAIRSGNEELLMKFYELHEKYPSYSGGVLHFIFPW